MWNLTACHRQAHQYARHAEFKVLGCNQYRGGGVDHAASGCRDVHWSSWPSISAPILCKPGNRHETTNLENTGCRRSAAGCIEHLCCIQPGSRNPTDEARDQHYTVNRYGWIHRVSARTHNVLIAELWQWQEQDCLQHLFRSGFRQLFVVS